MNLYILFVAIFGVFFGSFLNVLADRLPHGETLLGRSKCDSCSHMLHWNDLIPLVSYVALKGKCRYCKQPFSVQYALTELLTGIVFAVTFYLSYTQYYSPTALFLHIVIVSSWIVMILSDLRYFILPDSMQVLFAIGAFLHSIFVTHSWKIPEVNLIPLDIFFWVVNIPLVAGLFVALPLFLVFYISKGKGMGFGDVKLAFILGILLGPWNGLLSLYIAFILGGILGGSVLLLRKAKLKSKIPFGPFLIFGAYTMLFFQSQIIKLIQFLYGF